MNKYSYRIITGARRVTVIILRNVLGDPSSNPELKFLNEAVCISQSTNTVGKGMNQTILFTVMSKIVGQVILFSLGITTSLREGKL